MKALGYSNMFSMTKNVNSMYDTIHLWLPTEKAGSINVQSIYDRLNEAAEHQRSNGVRYITGNLKKGSRVSLSESGLSFKGSLAKYSLPDNFHTLTRSDTERAIEMLSDELSLPMGKANVNRIDFAENLIMQHPPQTYYPHLGESKHFKKLMQPSSVYWQNGNRTKLVYDKCAEAKAKRLTLPKVWQGQNVLRFETRWLKRLQNRFNMPEVVASNLYDEGFYMLAFDKWLEEYEAIGKYHQNNFNPKQMNSPKDFWKQIQLIAINALGQDEVLQEIEQMRRMETFDKPEYYSRLKKEVRQLCSESKLHSRSELVDELDSKMKNAKRYYR
jgi:hypothetical protein